VPPQDVEFVSGGAVLRGWLYLPAGPGPYAGVVITAGFNCVKEQLVAHDYPRAFSEAGLAVLLYDHPNCGDSEGTPRQELDPLAQERGYRDAITFLSQVPDVDPDAIGIWGTSYSGGLVLGVAAADRRVKCVVSQVPTVSGGQALLRRYTPDGIAELRRQWAADRQARLRGEPPAMVAQIGETGPSAEYFASLPDEILVNWVNAITLRTVEYASEYEPAAFIQRISPTPLLMIVADDDTTTFTEEELAAYQRALEPKRLMLVPGGHHSVYSTHLAATTAAAVEWLQQHLGR
jgi:fermentation-respiration switch protein FrsA (DUF1100 family)